MTTLTNEGIIAQLGWSTQIIKATINVMPLRFRSPYGDIVNRVHTIAKAMNFTPVMWAITGTFAQQAVFDLGDFVVPSSQQSAAQTWVTFQSLLTAADAYGKGLIVFKHDPTSRSTLPLVTPSRVPRSAAITLSQSTSVPASNLSMPTSRQHHDRPAWCF